MDTLKHWFKQPSRTPSWDLKTSVTLLMTPVLLTLFWYFGRIPYYYKAIVPHMHGWELTPRVINLMGYYYFAFSSIVLRLLIPIAVIKWLFKAPLRDFGFRLKGTGSLGVIYLVLLGIMLPILYMTSASPVYQAKYPLYHYAGQSLGLFLIYEFSYVLIFLSGEAFWRGFMVHALAPKFGLYALPIMAIPYAMIHFGKPFGEALGAILTGLVLGYLSLKHRSFWLGVLLHSSIGFFMDLFCLWRKGSLFGLL